MEFMFNEKLQIKTVLFSGEFGVIYKASLNRIGGDQEIVAVKTLKGGDNNKV